MKRMVTLLLSLALAGSLAACGTLAKEDLGGEACIGVFLTVDDGSRDESTLYGVQESRIAGTQDAETGAVSFPGLTGYALVDTSYLEDEDGPFYVYCWSDPQVTGPRRRCASASGSRSTGTPRCITIRSRRTAI